MRLATKRARIDEERAKGQVSVMQSTDGVNYIDTAFPYHGGK